MGRYQSPTVETDRACLAYLQDNLPGMPVNVTLYEGTPGYALVIAPEMLEEARRLFPAGSFQDVPVYWRSPRRRGGGCMEARMTKRFLRWELKLPKDLPRHEVDKVAEEIRNAVQLILITRCVASPPDTFRLLGLPVETVKGA